MFDNVSVGFLLEYFSSYPVNKSFKINGKWIDIPRRGNTLYSKNQQQKIDKQSILFLNLQSTYLYHITIAPDITNQHESYKQIKQHLPRIRRYLKYHTIGFIDVIESEYNGTGHIHMAIKSNKHITPNLFLHIPYFHTHIIESEITDTRLLLYIFKQQGIYSNIKRSLLRLKTNYPYPYKKYRRDTQKLYNVFYLKYFNMRPVRYFTNPQKYSENTLKMLRREQNRPVLAYNTSYSNNLGYGGIPTDDPSMDSLTDDPTDNIMIGLLQSTLPMEDQIRQIQTGNANIINNNTISNDPSMDSLAYDSTGDYCPGLYDLYKQNKSNNTNNQTIKRNKINHSFNTKFIQEIRYNEYNQH
jgi:hypothetical protein